MGCPPATHEKDPDGPLPQWPDIWEHIAHLDWALWDYDLPQRTEQYFGSRCQDPSSCRRSMWGAGTRICRSNGSGAFRAGGSRRDLPDHLMTDCWRRHKTGAGDVLGKNLEWEKPSVTIWTEFFKPRRADTSTPRKTGLSRTPRRP